MMGTARQAMAALKTLDSQFRSRETLTAGNPSHG